MRLYYRISDKSYAKAKLAGATKEVCLMNFIKVFSGEIFPPEGPGPGYVPPMKIVADRCERPTVKMLAETGLPTKLTDLGNAGSVIGTIKLAIEECEGDDIVYFCEDDYLHLGNAPTLLKEGLSRSEYVSLYDHPDKYTHYYNGGETSKVFRTRNSHWRYTVSTCMTFGTYVSTLREDLDIWEKYTTGPHPHDHYIFCDLNEKGRRLAVCLPGVACHTDLTFSGEVNSLMIDPWAIDLMIREFEWNLAKYERTVRDKEEGKQYLVMREAMEGKQGWDKLIALDALSQFVK